jgi:hypothetical protein
MEKGESNNEHNYRSVKKLTPPQLQLSKQSQSEHHQSSAQNSEHSLIQLILSR